jgi:hypothetical protein
VARLEAEESRLQGQVAGLQEETRTQAAARQELTDQLAAARQTIAAQDKELQVRRGGNELCRWPLKRPRD